MTTSAPSSGFTLVEVLLAIVVIGVAFLALALTQVTSFGVTRTATQTAEARDIASMKMEQLRALGYEVLDACVDSGTAPCTGGPVTGGASSLYEIEWSVEDALTTPPLAPSAAIVPRPLLNVQVRVTWAGDSYALGSYLSCADAGAASSTSVDCPEASFQ